MTIDGPWMVSNISATMLYITNSVIKRVMNDQCYSRNHAVINSVIKRLRCIYLRGI